MEVLTMYKTSSNFSVSCFRNRVVAWLLLTIFLYSFVPSVSFAQQPTATISALSGEVLVSGQTVIVGTILSAGDTIRTQAGASVVLELSDGSEIHLGEKTQINIADLTQTATGVRVSYIKLLAGRLRALLSPGHQQEGSSFTIETPNAQVGVKFSQPDVEVSYDPEKQETVGIAHTIELIATNLLTDETKLVPVGSSVIIIGMMMKVIAGTTAAAIAAGTETVAAETATGIGTGTKVAIGAGAVAAAGGVAAVAVSSGDENDGDNSGDNDANTDLSGTWSCSGSCFTSGPEKAGCFPDSPVYIMGEGYEGLCFFSGSPYKVIQSGNMLSGSLIDPNFATQILTGSISGDQVSFTIEIPDASTTMYNGTIDWNTMQIHGDFFGSGYCVSQNPELGTVFITWSGNFAMTINKSN